MASTPKLMVLALCRGFGTQWDVLFDQAEPLSTLMPTMVVEVSDFFSATWWAWPDMTVLPKAFDAPTSDTDNSAETVAAIYTSCALCAESPRGYIDMTQ